MYLHLLVFPANNLETVCPGSFAHFFHFIHWGFPGGSDGKESACSVRDLGSIPGLGTSPGEGKGYPLQFSGLENSMACAVHRVGKSRTRLSDFNFHFLKGVRA